MNNLEDQKNYNCEVTLEDGSNFKVYANWMHNEKLDFWEGWKCKAGVNRIMIFDDMVYSGECKNNFLGNLDNWDLIEDFTTCKQKRCTGCTDDLVLEKYAPLSTQSIKETRDPS